MKIVQKNYTWSTPRLQKGYCITYNDTYIYTKKTSIPVIITAKMMLCNNSNRL